MGTIVTRKRSDGTTRYRAQVRIKKRGKVVYSESKTFGKRAIAKAWIREREEKLSQPGELARVTHPDVTVGQLFKRYREEVSALRPFGRSKDSALKMLEKQDIADLDALKVTARDVVEHARQRRLGGTGPVTVGTDVTWIRVVFKYARRAWGIPVDVQAIEDAAETLREAKLTSRPRRRTRRPTAAELEKLEKYFLQRRTRSAGPGRPSKIPMDLIIWLAVYSARREDELCRIMRDDMDKEHGLYLVRDVKHPDGSAGNDREAYMPDPGWQVVERILEEVPSEDGRLLPFNTKTVGTYFTEACKVLGIEDLRFHDLRHETLSRLAEDGATIPELQQVSLHESWSSLSVYVNMGKGKKRPRRAEWSGLEEEKASG